MLSHRNQKQKFMKIKSENPYIGIYHYTRILPDHLQTCIKMILVTSQKGLYGILSAHA